MVNLITILFHAHNVWQEMTKTSKFEEKIVGKFLIKPTRQQATDQDFKTVDERANV
jgi:hypothetical protein